MKAGYRTTEFWTMLATGLVGLLVAFGVIGLEEQDSITQALGAAIAAISQAAYAVSRGLAKSGS